VKSQTKTREAGDVKDALSALREGYAAAEAALLEIEELRLEHEALESNLRDELADKRLALLGFSKKKHLEYLSQCLEKENEQTERLYAEFQDKITEIFDDMKALDNEDYESLNRELGGFRRRVRQTAEQAKARREAACAEAEICHAESLDALALKPIDDAALYSMRKSFFWQKLLGHKLIAAGGAVILWCCAVYLFHYPLMPSLRYSLGGSAGTFAALASVTLGFMAALLLPHLKKLNGGGTVIASAALGAVNAVWLVIFNATEDLSAGEPMAAAVLFVLYAAVNTGGAMWIRDFLSLLTKRNKLPEVWYPLLMSGLIVLLAAQNLTVRLSLGPQSLILTLLIGLTAAGWALFGFAKRNGLLRVCGLALSSAAVLKLFVLDLHHPELLRRIVHYIAAGVVLAAISFVYRYFGKRLPLDGGAPPVIE
jgi:hypothetical protein